MAATLVTIIKKFIGTATERAGLSTADLPVGSEYFENDTGQTYVLGPAGTWVVKADAVKLTGSLVEEVLTQADAVANVLTFSAPITAVEIYHDEAIKQNFIVNGIPIPVAAGGWARPIGGTPSAEVTIPAGVTCDVKRLV